MISRGFNNAVKIYTKRAFVIFLFALAVASLVGGAVFVYRFSLKNYQEPIAPFVPEILSESEFKGGAEDLLLIADGGFAARCPRDSSASVVAAAKAGYKAVLLFVRESSDGKLVVSREERIDKMTDKKGAIKNLSFEKLMKAKIDNGANAKRLKGLRLLSFDEALKICSENKLSIIIEAQTLSDAALERMLIALSEHLLIEKSVLALWDGTLLKKLANKKDMPKLYYSVEALSEDFGSFLRENKIQGILFGKGEDCEKLSKMYRSEGYELCCRDINEISLLKRLAEEGITGFTTQKIALG